MDHDLIKAALRTQAPLADIPGHTGSSHWVGVCTVYNEANQAFLVTGYDMSRPRLSQCAKWVNIEIASIYEIIPRDHYAIAALGMQNAPICHYARPALLCECPRCGLTSGHRYPCA